jgi:RNA exonuclease NGL2
VSTSPPQSTCRWEKRLIGAVFGTQSKSGTGVEEPVSSTRYQYERVRQFIILLRSLRAFQKQHNIESWPAIMAGGQSNILSVPGRADEVDFNSSPCEAPYQLLVNPAAPLPDPTRQRLEASRRLHNSVDKIAHAASLPAAKPEVWSDDPGASQEQDDTPGTTKRGSDKKTSYKTPAIIPHPANAKPVASATAPAQSTKPQVEKDDEGEAEGAAENGEDLPKTNQPGDADGILTVDELQRTLRDLLGEQGLNSAYDVGAWQGKEDDTFASRGGWPQGAKTVKGGNEPGYTCFTGLFQLTLGMPCTYRKGIVDRRRQADQTDYLFIIPPLPAISTSEDSSARVHVRQVLRPARKVELGKGLPIKGKSASDHLAVGCEVVW